MPKILSVTPLGRRRLFNLRMKQDPHNYIHANGLVSKNSHAVSYSALSTSEMWLKYHYPAQYMTALIDGCAANSTRFGVNAMEKYINYARKRDITVFSPDVNSSAVNFTTDGAVIRYSLGHIKNVASSAEVVVANAPYKDMKDLYERAVGKTVSKTGKTGTRKLNKKVVDSLIAAGAFDSFGSRNDMVKQYYECRKEPESAYEHTDHAWHELEREMTGLVLSIPPDRAKFTAKIKQLRCSTIDDLEGKSRTKVFGRIISIQAKTSKKGNQMYVVTLSDGLDSMSFFVFGGGMMKFREEVKTGYVVAVPLKKFDDSETRFYDVDRDTEVIEK